MPYIHQDIRDQLAAHHCDSATPGQLNYTITNMILEYIGDDVNYTTLNEVIGVLECVKLELYRRMASPHEDKKIKENGDVYPKL